MPRSKARMAQTGARKDTVRAGKVTHSRRPRTSAALARKISPLGGLIKPRQRNPLDAYWELGRQATQILSPPSGGESVEITTDQLATEIGLKDANVRHPKGHCQSCGYDLTGNTAGVCPECGTPI